MNQAIIVANGQMEAPTDLASRSYSFRIGHCSRWWRPSLPKPGYPTRSHHRRS